MNKRKKNLIIIQVTLFLIGILIIIFTYYDRNQTVDKTLPSKNQNNISSKLNNQNNLEGDVFYNIKYSGIDLAGTRYILTSEEAVNNNINPELVNMKFVEVNFYFKDGTVLNVTSDKGVYNNKTLDMEFYRNVEAVYEGSNLFAEKANYSNSKSFLEISENVVVTDPKGTIAADKLFFDIKKQNLNIISFNNNKINANVNVK